MRASSTFNFELGKSTRECFAREALRIRVSKSAIGSVVILPRPCVAFQAPLQFHFCCRTGVGRAGRQPRRQPHPNSGALAPEAKLRLELRVQKLPARLGHARNFTLQREPAET